MPTLLSAARSLIRARWFTITATLTIALGLGTSVTIFSIVAGPCCDRCRITMPSVWCGLRR
jgi:heme/copper-type cytochrome/quinol oxidase subunit 1